MHSERLIAYKAAFADLARQSADPHPIATTAVTTWRDVYAALMPIIGPRGVCALYQRSLHLHRAEFPWLAAVQATALDSGDFDALRSALDQQPSAIGSAAHIALLETFCDLLSNLIGDSLTERLLSIVWDRMANGFARTGK